MIPRTPLRLAAAGVLLAGLAGALAATPPAMAANAPLTSAYGIQMMDSDGGTLQAQAPLSEYVSGPTVEGSLASTSDVYRLNTTRTAGLSTRAAADGALARVESGTFQLRDRVPVTFTGLEATCGTDGTTAVSFDTLTVDGVNVLDAAKLSEGYTYDLPNSATWGPTKLFIGERSVVSGRVQVTALRIEAAAGWSEIWRVRLGTAACTPSTNAAADSLVSGVSVTSQAGASLIPSAPRLTEPGTVTAANVRAAGSASKATDVTVSHNEDGSSAVRIGSFTQIPDTSSVGEYMWSALRVYGLNLDVAANGGSKLTFDRDFSAVFVNGVWINTGTDLYTGLDTNGVPRVKVHLNERVTQSDGSILITALRYEDLTGAYPSVSLGTVHWTAPAVTPDPGPAPEPTTDPVLPPRFAFALDAHGPSAVDPAALAARPVAGSTDSGTISNAPESANSASIADGAIGQIKVTDAVTSSTADASTVSLGSLSLYPGSSAEVALSDVKLVVTAKEISVTTGGGTVAGTPVAAGAIAPNTVIAVEGRTMTVTLNKQSASASGRLLGATAEGSTVSRVADGSVTVTAVDVDDERGVGSHVRAAVVTADALEIPDTGVDPGAGGGTQPGTGGGGTVPGSDGTTGSGAGLGNGAIGIDDVTPAAGNLASRGLASTGFDGGSWGVAIIASLLALAAGAGLVVTGRRRRARRG